MKGLMKLWYRHKGRCWYCFRLTWVEGSMSKAQARASLCSPLLSIAEQRRTIRLRRATREHLKRKAEGGIRTKDNIVLACNDCNSTRGLIPPNDWKKIRMGIVDGISGEINDNNQECIAQGAEQDKEASKIYQHAGG